MISSSALRSLGLIMDDIIRVSGKKIDDLQSVISLCRKNNYEVPLQFVNMK